jgi:hypothetical protein
MTTATTTATATAAAPATATTTITPAAANMEKNGPKEKNYRPNPLAIAYEQKMSDLDARIATAKAKLVKE